MTKHVLPLLLMVLGLGIMASALADPRCTIWLDNDSSHAARFTVDGRFSCDALPGHVCEFLPDCSGDRAATAHCVVAMLSSGTHAVTVTAGSQTLNMQLPLTYYPAESDPDFGDEPEEYSRHCVLQDSGSGVAVQCKD